MILKIDTTSSIPVYAQIVDQIKRAISIGTLKCGESLPSLRETAINLRVNPLTVGKAYKLLEQDGLIETKHGLGSFVTLNAQSATDEYRHIILTRLIDNLLLDAHHMGVSPNDLRTLFEERLQASSGFNIDDLIDDVLKGDGNDK